LNGVKSGNRITDKNGVGRLETLENLKIIPSSLKGEVTIPPSKSISHRAIIAAGLADGVSQIENIIFSEDIQATCEGMEALGVEIKREGRTLIIEGRKELNPLKREIHCRESGSTLRFLIPLALLVNEPMTFLGEGRLKQRPLGPYLDIFQKQGIEYQYENELPLTVKGLLNPGRFEIPGNISSQFITGLLFALPLLDGNSEIVIKGSLESRPYIDLTIDVLKHFSVQIENQAHEVFHIKGFQKYRPAYYHVEGDYSQAAFWIVAGILGEEIVCKGLKRNSYHGDRVILDIVKEMGGSLSEEDGKVIVKPSKTKGVQIDASQCPDIVPILAVLAAFSEGKTEIVRAERLRIKESDRLKAIASELNRLGAEVYEQEDGLIIFGKDHLRGGIVDSWNDHRIAMALAIASIRCREPVILTNSSAVKKSYPNFFEDFKKLGGKLDEQHG